MRENTLVKLQERNDDFMTSQISGSGEEIPNLKDISNVQMIK